MTRLHDGIEQLENGWDDGGSDGDRSFNDESDRPWVMETDGIWRPKQPNEWEYVNDNMDMDEDVNMDENMEGIQRNDLHINDTMERDGELKCAGQVSEFHTHETTLVPNVEAKYMEGSDTHQSMRDESCSPLDESEVSTMLESTDFQDDGHDEALWKRFEISATAPPDHAFFSSSPGQPSKSFLGRLRREYHILATSLPGKHFLYFLLVHSRSFDTVDSILVRAYEDRTDLLRSLIVGPENTPYEDAPFVIDWMLDSNFPNSPPIAHFLSWTNGNGRGKIFIYTYLDYESLTIITISL